MTITVAEMEEEQLFFILNEHIKRGIKAACEQIADKYKQKAIEQIQGSIDEVVAKTVINFSKSTEFEFLRDNLVITIKKEDIK